MMATYVVVWLLVTLLWIHGSRGDEEDYMTCCIYCRSQPQFWYEVEGFFQLINDNDYTKLQSPPAYLADDEEVVLYTYEGREYKLHYAGALMKIKHKDLSNLEALRDEQYVQIDLASPKYIGGLVSQGGFYEEKLFNQVPYKESWVSDFVVSYSNTTEDFQFYENQGGSIEWFRGGSNRDERIITQFDYGIVSRYLRFHPLQAQDEEGKVERTSIRLTAITCSKDICVTPKINCLLSDWSAWEECTDAGGSYKRSRERTIRRVQACGGARCGDLQQSEACTPPEPVWKSVLQYLAIVVVILILIFIVAFIIYKKTHRDRVEVIVVRENDDEDDDFKPRPNFAHPPPGAPPAASAFKPNLPRLSQAGGGLPSQPKPFAAPPSQPMSTVN